MAIAEANEEIATDLKCNHCGLFCDEVVWFDDKPFCCEGCKTVFEILHDNDLCAYYDLDQLAATSLKDTVFETYAYLDDPEIRKRILAYDSETFSRVTFAIPAIHCVSCIWLLENLQKINRNILRAEVNFARKEITIDFQPGVVKLSGLAGILGSLGYAPHISLETDNKPRKVINRSAMFKLSVAGFCFGNVMLFSFPEYLGIDQSDRYLMEIFSWLNLTLSVPVLVYSGSSYLISAVNAFRQRRINIDVPIAAGLMALFVRSSYDIISASGPGYFDSFTGLVFFLLIGRWFQSKTYESLAFDRDFKSYFPLAVQKLSSDEWKPTLISALERGDTIRIRNMEIIPADSTLIDERAYIDYSFVTGESKPVMTMKGDAIYAGGRLIGGPGIFTIDKKTSQSQLTSLWNNEVFRKVRESKYQRTIDRAAKIFTWVVLGIAAATAAYWQHINPSQMWLVLTSVLMVACPCALALAAPFTYGSMLRVFGKNHFYLKHADVIETLASVDAVVFDKTGTVTHGKKPDVAFYGSLTPEELMAIKTVAGASTHPLSNMIAKSINRIATGTVCAFVEIPGKGIQGEVNGSLVKLGAADFAGADPQQGAEASNVYVSVDSVPKGFYSIRISLRTNIGVMLNRLGRMCVALLSGDNDSDRSNMTKLFNPQTSLVFNQTPQDKLAFVRNLQRAGQKVLMVGDGLNDSGALKQSDVGIAITDDTGVFTPACDGILKGDQLSKLDKFLMLARYSVVILKIAFVISFLYNAVALTFAVTGNLTPLVAAVLMPLSSISVVGFSSLAVYIVGRKIL